MAIRLKAKELLKKYREKRQIALDNKVAQAKYDLKVNKANIKKQKVIKKARIKKEELKQLSRDNSTLYRGSKKVVGAGKSIIKSIKKRQDKVRRNAVKSGVSNAERLFGGNSKQDLSIYTPSKNPFR